MNGHRTPPIWRSSSSNTAAVKDMASISMTMGAKGAKETWREETQRDQTLLILSSETNKTCNDDSNSGSGGS